MPWPERQAPFKALREIELVTGPPKTIGGKIRRVELLSGGEDGR